MCQWLFDNQFSSLCSNKTVVLETFSNNSNVINRFSSGYISVFINEVMVPSAIVLGYTLERHCMFRQRILLVRNISQFSINILSDFWTKVIALDSNPIEIKNINISTDTNVFYYNNTYLNNVILNNNDNHRIKHSWMKIFALLQTDYEKVVYLDPDIIILDNLDEMFSIPFNTTKYDLLAVWSEMEDEIMYKQPQLSKFNYFNFGVFIVRPSLKLFEKWLYVLRDWCPTQYPNKFLHDQRCINTYYTCTETECKWKAISWIYNNRRNIHPNNKLIHFSCTPEGPAKPYLYPNTAGFYAYSQWNRKIITLDDYVLLWWVKYIDAITLTCHSDDNQTWCSGVDTTKHKIDSIQRWINLDQDANLWQNCGTWSLKNS